jgi:hypothetical protein
MCAFCIPEASTGRLRHAVPKVPAKSSVPPRLPLHKTRLLPTRSESTLLQLLIPLHFNSRRYNVHKKPWERTHRSSHQVLQLVTPLVVVIPRESRTSAPPSGLREETSAPPSGFCEENLLSPSVLASLHRYVVTSHLHAQQCLQPQPPLWFTSRFSGYPGGGSRNSGRAPPTQV